MSRLVAVEWDQREIRLAVASRRGRQLVLESLQAVELPEAAEERKPAEIGGRIRRALEQAGVRRGEALVSIGRGQIELRQMQLPPAPEAEWPEMVRLTAMRQFAHLGDDWPLDFVPLPASGQEGIPVLAAALAPQQLAPIRAVCEAAQLELKHLALRPFAAAGLVDAPPAEGMLLVDLLAEEADLSILVAGTPVLLRTVRLAADPEARLAGLMGEIRRTLAAARNQLAGRSIASALVFGAAGDHGPLVAQLEKDLGLKTELRDPLALITKLRNEVARAPELPGRFAPLLGMLQTEAAGGRQAIDFLAPRKAPTPVNQRKRNWIIGGAVAAAALLLFLIPTWQLWSLDWEAERLQKELNSLTAARDKAKLVEKELAEIDKWAVGDLIWLEEMKLLCERLPPAESVMLSQLVAAARPDGGQGIAEGQAPEWGDIPDLERGLTQPGYTVRGSGAQEDPRGGAYPYRFQETISIIPDDKRPAEKPAPPPDEAPAEAAAAEPAAEEGGAE